MAQTLRRHCAGMTGSFGQPKLRIHLKFGLKLTRKMIFELKVLNNHASNKCEISPKLKNLQAFVIINSDTYLRTWGNTKTYQHYLFYQKEPAAPLNILEQHKTMFTTFSPVVKKSDGYSYQRANAKLFRHNQVQSVHYPAR